MLRYMEQGHSLGSSFSPPSMVASSKQAALRRIPLLPEATSSLESSNCLLSATIQVQD